MHRRRESERDTWFVYWLLDLYYLLNQFSFAISNPEQFRNFRKTILRLNVSADYAIKSGSRTVDEQQQFYAWTNVFKPPKTSFLPNHKTVFKGCIFNFDDFTRVLCHFYPPWHSLPKRFKSFVNQIQFFIRSFLPVIKISTEWWSTSEVPKQRCWPHYHNQCYITGEF